MNELKPCPFCGGEIKTAVITFDEKFYEPPYEAWYLEHADIVAAFEEHCPIPTTDTFYDTEAEAVEAWNTRRDEVVRCRDCKFFGYFEDGNETAADEYCCHWASLGVEPDGFCAWGERRDA